MTQEGLGITPSKGEPQGDHAPLFKGSSADVESVPEARLRFRELNRELAEANKRAAGNIALGATAVTEEK